MSALAGVRLTVLAGPTVPAPLPVPLLTALDGVEVSHADEGRSGFQLTFRAGRGPGDVADSAVLAAPALRAVGPGDPGGHVRAGADGADGRHRHERPASQPGREAEQVHGHGHRRRRQRDDGPGGAHRRAPGAARGRDRAQDHRVVRAVRAHPAGHPAADGRHRHAAREDADAAGTDLAYMRGAGRRFGYTSSTSRPARCRSPTSPIGDRRSGSGMPQPALNVNMGPETTVDLDRYLQLRRAPRPPSPEQAGCRTGASIPLPCRRSSSCGRTARPSLARDPALEIPSGTDQRWRPISRGDDRRSPKRGRKRADAVTGTGTSTSMRYGRILRARSLVDIRGAGLAFDGTVLHHQRSSRPQARRLQASFSARPRRARAHQNRVAV